MSFAVEPYSPFSDNMGFNLAGVPCVLLHSFPNKYFHTQFMTADKMDPDVFNATGIMVSEAAYLIANAELDEAKKWANNIKTITEKRLEDLTKQIESAETKSKYDSMDSKLEHLLERDIMAIESLQILVNEEENQLLLEPFAESLKKELAEKYDRQKNQKQTTTKYDKWKPKKIEKMFPPGHYYPNLDIKYEKWLEIGELMKKDDESFRLGRLRSIIQEIYNYSNGVLSFSEIIEKIGFEYNLRLDQSNFDEIIKALIKFGSIENNIEGEIQ
jgi:hypothetical protein